MRQHAGRASRVKNPDYGRTQPDSGDLHSQPAEGLGNIKQIARAAISRSFRP